MSRSQRIIKRRTKTTAKSDVVSSANQDDIEPLAELTQANPQDIVRNKEDQMGLFMVSLAAVYNDLKDLTAISYAMRTRDPGSAAVTPEAGEWRGRRSMLQRFSAGVLHELMRLIKEKKNLLQSAEFKQCVDAMSKEGKSHWQEVQNIAINGQANAQFAVLVYIRNNASFHYYQTKTISAAWENIFNLQEKNEFNSHAYYSIGHTMETTRFYFADAARQGVFRASVKLPTHSPAPSNLENEEVVADVAKKVNVALFFLLEAFLQLRGKGTAKT